MTISLKNLSVKNMRKASSPARNASERILAAPAHASGLRFSSSFATRFISAISEASASFVRLVSRIQRTVR